MTTKACAPMSLQRFSGIFQLSSKAEPSGRALQCLESDSFPKLFGLSFRAKTRALRGPAKDLGLNSREQDGRARPEATSAAIWGPY